MEKTPTQFLNYLVRRQCFTNKPNVLAFNFNGHIAEFDLKEFCLSTGLRGHNFPAIDLEEGGQVSELKSAFFLEDDKITRKDVDRTFKMLR